MEPSPIFQNSPAESDSAPALIADPGQVILPPTAGQNVEPVATAQTDRPINVGGSVLPEGQAVLPQVIPAGGAISKPPRGGFFKKLLVIALAAILLLAGGSAAAYFGYYVPNKPENIWSKALTNTGKGYDKLTQYTTSQFGSQSKGVKLDGTFKSTGSIAADGSFSGVSDGDNGEFTASLSATGLKVNLDAREIKSAAGSPDFYFKLDGLQGIGTLFGGAASQYEKTLNGINGSWYFVDHTFFDQYAKGTNTSLQISQNDVRSVLSAVGSAGKQILF
jgi:hypothetical protein